MSATIILHVYIAATCHLTDNPTLIPYSTLLPYSFPKSLKCTIDFLFVALEMEQLYMHLHTLLNHAPHACIDGTHILHVHVYPSYMYIMQIECN